MPTYQYHCPHCGDDFEEFQGINDLPITKCPKCGQKPRRIITGGAGFLLKGSGFYSTDYRSESYKAAARKETSGASSGLKTGSSAASKKSNKSGTKET
jgi:putative FmdB family regulatory protein